MNQSITVKDNLFAFLREESKQMQLGRISNGDKLILLIEQNYISLDSNYEILSLFQNKVTFELEPLLHFWLKHGRFIREGFNFENDFVLFSSKTKDKILLDSILNEGNEIPIVNTDVEIHDLISFMAPKTHHRLKHLSFDEKATTNLVLYKNIKYDLKNLLEPYLRFSKKIIIDDPFLYNPSAFHNFKMLISFLELSEITLKLYSKDCYIDIYGKNKKEKYSEYYDTFMNYINNIKNNGIHIKMELYNKTGHKDRYIVTDKIKIEVPGGLDFLNQSGKANIDKMKESIEIKINRL